MENYHVLLPHLRLRSNWLSDGRDSRRMEHEQSGLTAAIRDAVPHQGSHSALLLYWHMEGLFQLAQGRPRPLCHQLHPLGRAQGLVLSGSAGQPFA